GAAVERCSGACAAAGHDHRRVTGAERALARPAGSSAAEPGGATAQARAGGLAERADQAGYPAQDQEETGPDAQPRTAAHEPGGSANRTCRGDLYAVWDVALWWLGASTPPGDRAPGATACAGHRARTDPAAVSGLFQTAPADGAWSRCGA